MLVCDNVRVGVVARPGSCPVPRVSLPGRHPRKGVGDKAVPFGGCVFRQMTESAESLSLHLLFSSETQNHRCAKAAYWGTAELLDCMLGSATPSR